MLIGTARSLNAAEHRLDPRRAVVRVDADVVAGADAERREPVGDLVGSARRARRSVRCSSPTMSAGRSGTRSATCSKRSAMLKAIGARLEHVPVSEQHRPRQTDARDHGVPHRRRSSALCSSSTRSSRRRDPVLLLPSFMAAWLTIELAPWLLFWEARRSSPCLRGRGARRRARRGSPARAGDRCSAVGLVVHHRAVPADGRHDARRHRRPRHRATRPTFPRSHVLLPDPHAPPHAASRSCATSHSPTYGKKKVKLDVVKARRRPSR